MTKIIFFEVADWEQKYLKERLSNLDLNFYGSEEKIQNPDAEILCNFIHLRVDKEILSQFPKVKYITTRSTGYDHINVKDCQERGVQVSNVPTYGENTVAEFTFTLILALSRKLYQSVKRVKEQGLFSYEGLSGFDLMGKTLGVVGAGHIGIFVIKIAKGFGMKVLAYDPHPKVELAQEYGFEYADLDTVLQNSDIVTLHVPYMPATHHLINEERLQKMKPGALLINTARGGLVETESLIKALRSGHLAGAGLDVIEEEGFITEEKDLLLSGHPNEHQLKIALADHELMQMENVLVTPHNAFNTQEAEIRILDTTVANIQAYVKGTPINLVKF